MDWNIFHWSHNLASIFPYSYDLHFITLPFVIGILGSYLGLDIVGNLHYSQTKKESLFWICVGAIGVGVTIWAVHFAGILSLQLPKVILNYEFSIVILTLIAFIATCFIGYTFVKSAIISPAFYFFKGPILGIAIVGIYYLGIAALLPSFTMHFYVWRFIFSFVMGIFAAQVTLWLAIISNQGNFKHQLSWKILAAFIIGSAMFLLHYLCIKATIFTPKAITITKQTGLHGDLLAIYLTEIFMIVVGVALLVSTFRQAANLTLHRQNRILLATEKKLEKQSKELTKINIKMRELAAFPEENIYPIMRINNDGKLVFANKASRPLLNVWKINVGDKVPVEIEEKLLKSMDTRQPQKIEINYNNHHFLISIMPVHNTNYANLYGLDISDRKEMEQQLSVRTQAMEACPDGIIITDNTQTDNPIIYVNSAFEKITGYTSAEAFGKNCRFLQGSDRDQPGLIKLRELLEQQKSGELVLKNYRKDGSFFWNELHIAPVFNSNHQVTHFIGVQIDVSHRKYLEEQLIHHATHDTLTNLANRTLLLDRIQQAINLSQRSSLITAVLFLDLDRFKYINDSLGHKIGDEVLKIVAERIVACVRSSDTVARLGGDEFVIVLAGVNNHDAVVQVIKKCQKALAEGIIVNSHELILGMSIGVSIFPKDGEDPIELLKNADIAMYWAKETSKNTFQFYKPEMNLLTKEHLEFEKELRVALEKKQFVLHYQPFVDLETGKIVGAEALLRWSHPKIGIVPPKDFLHIAEELGLMGDIDDWVLDTAAKQNKLWQDAGLPAIKIAINVGEQQIIKKNLLETVKKVLQQTNLAPQCLELEINENFFMEDKGKIIPLLENLHALGVGLSIDDFGIGYSGLSSLKNYPVDKIKIDQSFIKHLNPLENDAAIIVAIIAMSKSLGLKILAEGVETIEQIKFLKSLHCDQIQGFYFSSPVTAESLSLLLRANHSLHIPEDK